MEYARKKAGSAAGSAASALTPPLAPLLTPIQQAAKDAEQQASLQRQSEWQTAHRLFSFTSRPAAVQRQVAAPVLHAASLAHQETLRVEQARPALQRQVRELEQTYPPTTIQTTIQRQQARTAPTPIIRQPQSTADWVTVMRQQAEQAEGQAMRSSEFEQVKALQRQVAQRLAGAYRQDRQVPALRTAEYAGHLVALQRHPISAQVAQVVLTQIPQGERHALQRAVDEALQRETAQQAQDAEATGLSALQRHLAELDDQATQPVVQRIQARRGAGSPLPEAVQRHLEQGLNHDLGAVRIHDDAEADKLATSVSATAFTTGTDIFFRAGRYQPNTRSGLELLAHEVTHTVQQSKGMVGKGIDPDAGLEAEARGMGAKLAGVMPSPKSLMPPNPHAPGVYSKGAALQRAQDGAASYFSLKPLYDLHPQAIQRWGNPLSWAADKGKEAVASGLRLIPGYKELCLTFGKDLVTGKAMVQDPNAILDALAGWVPGPLKEMLRAVRQQNLIPRAWAWFQGELGRLNLGGAVSEIGAAIGRADLGGAKNALMTRVNGLKSLVLGSARKIAEIALSAIEAGLGPVGKKVMATLRKSGDVILQFIRDPAKFAGNLLSALKQGFTQFSTNAGKWLKTGLGQWLTGASGFTFPTTLDVKGVFMTALSIMGLTYQAMRGRLVAQLGAGGAQRVAAAEGAGGALASMTKGLHTSPELMGHQAAVGKDVVDGLKTEVTTSLVTAGTAKVASMLIPGGAFVQAILTAFRTVQTLVSQSAQIMGVITNALGSVGAIAAGQVGAAAGFIERTIGGSIPIVLTFLGKVIGLGNFGGRIKATVMKMRARLDAVVDRIVARVKGLIGAGTGKGDMGTAKGKPGIKDGNLNTKKSLDVKAKVRQELARTLPKTFEKPEQIRVPLVSVFRKYKAEGLKSLRIQYSNKPLGEFDILAKASPFEKVALSTAKIQFTLDDLKKIPFGTVTLRATVNGRSVGPFVSSSGTHAESFFIAFMDNNWKRFTEDGTTPSIDIQLTSSMCGEEHADCAGKINSWAKSKNVHANIDILGVYKGANNKSSMAALQKIIDDPTHAVTLRAWDTLQATTEFASYPEKLKKRLLSKVRNAKAALEKLSGIELK